MVRSSLPPLFLLVLAQLACGSDKATSPPPVAVDSVPPVILHLLSPAEIVQPGDEVELRFRVRDAFGVKSATLTVHGAFEDSFSGDFEGVPTEVNAYTFLYVPNGSPIDEPAIVTLTVADEAGHTASAETRIFLRDIRAPLVQLDLGGLHLDETIRTGETLEIYVKAFDNHRLKYFGYEGAGLRDSVSATIAGDSYTFRLTVPPAWATQRPVLKAWARDVSGHVSEVTGISSRTVPVYDWVDHAITTFPLQQDLPLQVLWDAKRGAIYRLRHGPDVGGSTRIEGVDISSGANLPTVTFPRSPHDFTFSATGDSLVVIFFSDDEQALGIVELLSPNRSTSILPLQYDLRVNPRGPFAGHAAGGRFFVALVSGLYGARLLDVNFATGTQVIRSDIDGSAELMMNYPSFLPLPDGRLVIGSSFVPYPPDYRIIYSPTSNTFTPTFRLRSVSSRNYTASPSGRFMMGNTVFGAALDSITTVATQDWSSGSMALSPDGQFVYLSTLYGYQKVRLSDGAVLEQVRLPNQPLFLFAVADGTKLIAVTESAVRVIDLR